MKSVLSAIAIVATIVVGAVANASQEAQLRCVSESGVTVIAKSSNFEAFLEDCKVAVAQGDLCFHGERVDVLSLLEEISSFEILGSSHEMGNIWYFGKDQVKYEVYNYLDQSQSAERRISRCPN